MGFVARPPGLGTSELAEGLVRPLWAGLSSCICCLPVGCPRVGQGSQLARAVSFGTSPHFLICTMGERGRKISDTLDMDTDVPFLGTFLASLQ